MKLAAVEVGKEYVDKWGDRFRVLEKGNLERRVYGGTRADWTGHISTSPCVRVHWLNRDGSPSIRNNGHRCHLTGPQIMSTFEEWERQDTIRREVERGLQTEFHVLTKQAEQLTQALKSVGIDTTAIARRAGMTIEVLLSEAEAQALTKALA